MGKRYCIVYFKNGRPLPIGLYDASYWTRKGAVRALPYFRDLRWAPPIDEVRFAVWDLKHEKEIPSD